MPEWVKTLITVLIAVFGSSGFWAYIAKRNEKKDVKTQMLVGLAHDRILFLGMRYVERGYITSDEYENLYEYLYQPYEKMGGNGSAKRVMQEVNKLPIHSQQVEHKKEGVTMHKAMLSQSMGDKTQEEIVETRSRLSHRT